MKIFRRARKPRASVPTREYDADSLNRYLDQMPVADRPYGVIQWLVGDGEENPF